MRGATESELKLKEGRNHSVQTIRRVNYSSNHENNILDPHLSDYFMVLCLSIHYFLDENLINALVRLD